MTKEYYQEKQNLNPQPPQTIENKNLKTKNSNLKKWKKTELFEWMNLGEKRGGGGINQRWSLSSLLSSLHVGKEMKHKFPSGPFTLRLYWDLTFSSFQLNTKVKRHRCSKEEEEEKHTHMMRPFSVAISNHRSSTHNWMDNCTYKQLSSAQLSSLNSQRWLWQRQQLTCLDQWTSGPGSNDEKTGS